VLEDQLLIVVFVLEEYHYYIEWRRKDEESMVENVDEVQQKEDFD
jgi:hypothetical protein